MGVIAWKSLLLLDLMLLVFNKAVELGIEGELEIGL